MGRVNGGFACISTQNQKLFSASFVFFHAMSQAIWWWMGGMLLLAGMACQDPCENRFCENGGVCVDGTCECPTGFIGPNCNIALDPCRRADCVPGQTDTCVVQNDEPRCVCREGFEGERCEDRWEDKFAGEFSAQETCNGNGGAFNMSVETGPSPRQVTFINLNNQSVANPVASKVVGRFLNRTSIEIYEQFMAFGRVTGSGSIDASQTIFLTYEIVTATDTLQCNAVLMPR